MSDVPPALLPELALLPDLKECIEDLAATGWSLQALNEEVGRFREEHDLSWKQMKNLLNEMGCCLKNGKLFGSDKSLKRHLRLHREDMVSPSQVNPFPNIRALLVVYY